jgi:hypothetical protein
METANEWIKKMWYSYTVEYYSALKKNESILFTGKWIGLEIIILSEVSQVQKDKGYIFFPHVWKLYMKDKCIHKYIHDYTYIYIYITYKMFVIVKLFEGTGGGRKGKGNESE